MEEGGQDPRCAGGFWKLEKAWKLELPWSFRKECIPINSFWASDIQNCKIINCVILSHGVCEHSLQDNRKHTEKEMKAWP